MATRVCSKCGLAKTPDAYRKLAQGQSSPDGRRSVCRECERRAARDRRSDPSVRQRNRETSRRWYWADPGRARALREAPSNRERERRRAQLPHNKARRAAYIAELRAIPKAEKFRRGKCVDCGLVVTEENYVAFDFDHDDPATKAYPPSRCPSPAKMVAELAKCTLRCAVCHRVRSHREGHYARPAEEMA